MNETIFESMAYILMAVFGVALFVYSATHYAELLFALDDLLRLIG